VKGQARHDPVAPAPDPPGFLPDTTEPERALRAAPGLTAMKPFATQLTPTSTDADLDRLQQVCEQLAGFDEHVSVEWLDGAMTALAAGPRPKAVAEWKDKLFGDTWGRVFADPASDAEATAAVQARWSVLLRQLDPAKLVDAVDELRLAPVLIDWSEGEGEEDGDGDGEVDPAANDETPEAPEAPAAGADAANAPAGEGKGEDEGESEDDSPPMIGELWAHGFLEVVEMFPEDWPQPDAETEIGEAFDHAMMRIALLVMPPSDEEYATLVKDLYEGDTPTRDDLVHEALYSVQDIRMYWIENAPKPETRRVEAQPGRNDPCPCGSGKKFKKCHGAA
jgi:uncharacterized protein